MRFFYIKVNYVYKLNLKVANKLLCLFHLVATLTLHVTIEPFYFYFWINATFKCHRFCAQ